MTAMPIYGKTLENLQKNRESFRTEFWYIASRTQGRRLTFWPFYGKVKFASLSVIMRKMLKKYFFQNVLKTNG